MSQEAIPRPTGIRVQPVLIPVRSDPDHIEQGSNTKLALAERYLSHTHGTRTTDFSGAMAQNAVDAVWDPTRHRRLKPKCHTRSECPGYSKAGQHGQASRIARPNLPVTKTGISNDRGTSRCPHLDDRSLKHLSKIGTAFSIDSLSNNSNMEDGRYVSDSEVGWKIVRRYNKHGNGKAAFTRGNG